ncbi:MAG: Holliday junction DNA helicase RuvB [Candidatus Kerfeldbacteria bacterium RIFCSPLOWO2_01_FULL_48_11]|uniref:Holliday junction branch migration complex subunit RuvB n=1 Tax=Candidatus Kerfeldbacteria bacterium RIFCSPLOWO2_01_FULL_48_11 TaxID=1798543 RepID=A0A1G2AZP1_9BACT|nr:MAG: Holliday junction ATP-dependent DNA helicase RuvB [Parcubacteria group bacterium GW2011_GWC2_49_9]OGY82411.1 MAG: Holliday junction DNA helicase RuvB [Candidatus Kerfeldbacteria bacterium RIFCSPLOWO2_01_FULL_48_11]HCJ52341.1 Holliday junction branch migration DNA helicase RuvB [Candidatus Kerfeldbacteria bacterium]
MTNSRLVSPNEGREDATLDMQLRPEKLDEYVGQERVKENVQIFLEAARRRKQPLEHVLLHGGPGLGKTTLAHIIAREIGANIRITSGPAVEHGGDIAAILTNLEEGDILFIDEVHRLRRTVEEMLYPALEEFALDLIVGKGPSARTMRIELPHFTLIGATTKPHLLSAPLRDRFGVSYHLDFYTEQDIEKILLRSARILNVDLKPPAHEYIARRARWTPRIANRLLKRIRDYVQVKGDGVVTSDMAEQALAMLDIDQLGLDATDRRILRFLMDKHGGGPVGLNTIAASIGEDMDTIEDLYEPFLLQLGFLKRTSRGRAATKAAYEHLGQTPPADLQRRLM